MPVCKPLLHPKPVPISKLYPWIDLLDRLRAGDLGSEEILDRLLTSFESSEIEIFVGDPEKGYALRIRATGCGGSQETAFDARSSVMSGWLVVHEQEFPANSLERLRPLYYRQSSLPKWAAQNPPSDGRLRRETASIVKDCGVAGLRLSQPDFVELLARRTGATKRQASKYWSRTPRSWRKRGPKGPRSRQAGRKRLG